MAVEISGLDNVLMYDMVKLECDDIKQGLAACANRFSDLLLDNLVATHMEDNQRCVCVCVCVCVHVSACVCNVYVMCMYAIFDFICFHLQNHT